MQLLNQVLLIELQDKLSATHLLCSTLTDEINYNVTDDNIAQLSTSIESAIYDYWANRVDNRYVRADILHNRIMRLISK